LLSNSFDADTEPIGLQPMVIPLPNLSAQADRCPLGSSGLAFRVCFPGSLKRSVHLQFSLKRIPRQNTPVGEIQLLHHLIIAAQYSNIFLFFVFRALL